MTDYTVLDPTQLPVQPGLKSLPRQIGTFPAFRRALLAEAGSKMPLDSWKGRGQDDFGLMLFEMWAYVCDVLTFYDQYIANESYLRTALGDEAVTRLVATLGYVPRPPVAAVVDLALLLEGRQPVTIPAGTAFRSGSFDDEAPQVFQLDEDVTLHPFHNRATLVPLPDTSIAAFADEIIDDDTASFSALAFDRASLKLAIEDIAIITSPKETVAVIVTDILAYEDDAGNKLAAVSFSPSIELDPNLAPEDITVRKALHIGGLWTATSDDALTTTSNKTTLLMDGIYRRIKPDGHVVLVKSGIPEHFTAQKVIDQQQILLPTRTEAAVDADGDPVNVVVPAVTVTISKVTLNGKYSDESAKAEEVIVYYNAALAGTVTTEVSNIITDDSPLIAAKPIESGAEDFAPSTFTLNDTDGYAVTVDGSVADDGELTMTSGFTGTLRSPITMYGNMVQATRGETVTDEILGSGNASQANQQFTLKKSPLTYISAPTQDDPTGVKNTLTLYVNGVLWSEVPTLYGVEADEQVYIVRQNEDGESIITFGDGINGARVPTGENNIIAHYRHGAGEAAPPANNVKQLVESITGIKSVTNPVAAYGGADREDKEDVRTYAPRSALMLGRAVSLVDFEAVTATVSGVSAVEVAWRWSKVRQRPIVQVYYIGADGLNSTILTALQAASEPTTPFEVLTAEPVNVELTLDIEIDPRYVVNDVLGDVETALIDEDDGFLLPEHLGVGGTFFRSQLFDVVNAIDGVVAVRSVLWGSAPLTDYGKRAPTGSYYLFTVTLNGEIGA